MGLESSSAEKSSVVHIPGTTGKDKDKREVLARNDTSYVSCPSCGSENVKKAGAHLMSMLDGRYFVAHTCQPCNTGLVAKYQTPFELMRKICAILVCPNNHLETDCSRCASEYSATSFHIF